MKEIPVYGIGDVVTIRKEYHKGCSGDDYPRIFDIDTPFKFGGRKFIIVKQFKEDIAFCRVPDDGIRYILNGLPEYYFTSYMFDESGDWRDGVEWRPKNGDIVVADGHISIFYDFTDKEDAYSDYVSLNGNGQLFNVYFAPIPKAGFRPATHVERQKLFDALAKRGNRWNAEKKCIESLSRETEEKPFRYGGDIADFPPEIVEKMLEYQERQGNQRNIKVFEKDRWSLHASGGFSWIDTDEGFNFWDKVILCKKFDIFFELYPKDNPESVPTAVGISQDTADDLNVYIERLKDQLYESMRDQIYELTKDPCDFCGFFPSPGKIKTRSRKPIPKGGLYRKKKGFRPFGEVEKVKPVETRLHTKSK